VCARVCVRARVCGIPLTLAGTGQIWWSFDSTLTTCVIVLGGAHNSRIMWNVMREGFPSTLSILHNLFLQVLPPKLCMRFYSLPLHLTFLNLITLTIPGDKYKS
jgi:hypothetical protein